MKTLKFLFAVVLFFFFVMPCANAQGPKTTECKTGWVDWVPCADEAVTGEMLAAQYTVYSFPYIKT